MLARGDASSLLARAIEADARNDGVKAVVLATTACRWASATFSGMRHHLRVMMTTGDAADAWIAKVPEADFNLPGHLVADLVVDTIDRDGRSTIASFAALTLEMSE